MTPLVPMVTASQVAFWTLAPLMVIAALGMVLSRKAVHSALFLAGLMVALAVQYAALEAPFLFVTQIIVYTGAIMMLFLFVLMLVGVDSADSFVETIRGHRVASILAALALVVLLIALLGNTLTEQPEGLEQAVAPQGGNVTALAATLFTRWVFVFEATAALLITAAVGAMVLAHGEQIRTKLGQREVAVNRQRSYASRGEHPGPRPNSGVFARHNAIHTPALLPDGTVSELSLSKTLADRGAFIDAGELKAPTSEAFRAIAAVRTDQDGELE